MLVQVRAVPKRRSTHISNYQSNERESYEHDETSMTEIPVCPQERFSSYKTLSRLVPGYKRDWATLLHHFYFCYLSLATSHLTTQSLVTDNFSASRFYRAENHLSDASAPRWVRHSYLSKGLRLIPYTCGSSPAKISMQSSRTGSPRQQKYATNKALEQKLIGPMEESLTKE